MAELKKEEKIIEIVNVSKIFDETAAVQDISFYVRKGEFITFLGPSGCGKTTTLRMIAGFDIPTSGKILLSGKDITNLPPNKRPVNTVFQRYALFPHYNIYDNIAFGLKLKKVPVTYMNDKGETYTKLQKLTRKEIDEKVRAALAVVDLEGFEKRSVSTLSGGQQQRVAIARAIVNEPEILLLDEPLGALDLKMRKEMQIELKEMHRKLGITFIYVTHDQEEALTMSDTIVVMKDGRIQQIGTPTSIYNEPANAFVADFIGDSNILNGTMVAKYTVRFCNKNFKCVDDYEKNEKVDVVVRPEDIVMTEPENGMLTGRVVSVVFKGVHYEITAMVGRSEMVIQSTQSRKVGDIIGMNIGPDDIHIMKKEFTVNQYDGYITKKIPSFSATANSIATSPPFTQVPISTRKAISSPPTVKKSISLTWTSPSKSVSRTSKSATTPTRAAHAATSFSSSIRATTTSTSSALKKMKRITFSIPPISGTKTITSVSRSNRKISVFA